jgi:hypothetical protein
MTIDRDWVTEPTDTESLEVREIYALAGLALYSAQCLEHGIVNVLGVVALIRKLRKNRETDWADSAEYEKYIDNIWDDAFRKTLGSLISSLRTSPLTRLPKIEVDLNRSLDARNQLVHRYFRERAESFCTSAGRRQMAEELTVMRELFTRTDHMLEELTRPVQEALGMTQDNLDKYVELLREGVPFEQAHTLAFSSRAKR